MVPVLGWIDLCPKFLTLVQIEKTESAEEMAKRGFGPRAIQQQLSSHYESCEECEYFQGLREGSWKVRCAYPTSQLPPALRKLIDISWEKHTAERNTELDTYRKERWDKLVKT